MYDLTVEGTFSAAHRLRDYEGCCERLHGHNWRVQAMIRTSRLNEIGLGIDFKILKSYLHEVLQQLDHSVLNDHPDFTEQNPSCENLAYWIYQELKGLMANDTVAVAKVTVFESADSSCCYYED